ncbi:unnamed protein product [Chrysoparadoxa australica]
MMEQAKSGIEAQPLKPLPDSDRDLGYVKQLLGVQSSEIPQFPEYDGYGHRIPLQDCTFRPKQKMELHVYVNTEEELTYKDSDLVWRASGLRFWSQATETLTKDVNLTAATLGPFNSSNSSVYAHIMLTKQGVSPNPEHESWQRSGVAYKRTNLVKYQPKPKEKKIRSLLGASEAEDEAKDETEDEAKEGQVVEVQEGELQAYWKPTLSIDLVDMYGAFQRNHIPPNLAGHITFDNTTGNYHPIVYINEFWLQLKHLVPINETVETLPLTISYNMISFMKFTLMSQMQRHWSMQANMGMGSEAENDHMRELLGDTAPWLLALTMVVSTLHMLFDFLAFKNDVAFWKKNKSLAGLSVRMMAFNFGIRLIILLYLLDSETSWTVLGSSAVGVVIEFWKLGKAFTGSLDWGEEGQKYIIPRLRVAAKASYSTSATKEYDQIAMSHLMYLVMPLVLGYSAYSLTERQYKSWYSWVISSLVGFVYVFGFIAMTPQLFINYKLKSVAHLPWRVMVYKSLNTFIDDLFSFIQKMPTMHRLACFRDDIIFFIFLYQKWIYPVDKNRINEYGQGGDDTAAALTDGDAPRVPKRDKRDVIN